MCLPSEWNTRAFSVSLGSCATLFAANHHTGFATEGFSFLSELHSGNDQPKQSGLKVPPCNLRLNPISPDFGEA